MESKETKTPKSISKQNKNKLTDVENRLVVIRGKGGWREGGMGEEGQLDGNGWKLDAWW